MGQHGRALRVLHVLTRAQRRGAEASAHELGGRLSDLGADVRVVALAPGTTGAPLQVPVLGPGSLHVRTLLGLRRRMRGADVVVAHGSRTLPAVAIAGLGLDVPAVYQNIGDPRFWAGHGTRRQRVRLLLRRMRTVAALTETAARVLHDDFDVPAARLEVVPNWRDAQRFRPATPEERRRTRTTWDVPPDEQVVGMVGALSVEKGIDLAIETVGRLPGVRLVLVGDGPERARLESLADAVAPGRVVFVGAVTDVLPAYAGFDMLLLTSTSEGVPGVLIEAGLCGLPVVTTDVGFVADVVEDGCTGWVVTGRDPEVLAQGVRTALAADPEVGRRARERCAVRYDTAVVAQRWLDVLTVTADGSRPR